MASLAYTKVGAPSTAVDDALRYIAVLYPKS
jgi:hypothetical protein